MHGTRGEFLTGLRTVVHQRRARLLASLPTFQHILDAQTVETTDLVLKTPFVRTLDPPIRIGAIGSPTSSYSNANRNQPDEPNANHCFLCQRLPGQSADNHRTGRSTKHFADRCG